ncbi:sarcosine oxidase subunit gamma [Granulibacter bethesdensis]|uniref:Sarcosine oxidase gamma subunit n=1 Tax=Granulibacter bethesdensis (strain ATCC BAA-1260 / CGDNIH1) TaxID=391165 RepID=Q0BVT1_GRABC|nr:sarcosine oxidase subunit gamma family protein [Granulibacter bethesdensis]ABI61071.1 Sarcosine oxidase gamma subunit [Granulibacter bethesdensis CGDNIH1]APH50846.1 Sarcosine oxidase gamma subunit [Granulibacter bethesdensis]APH63540.1 Sarcosine oxidase gamma subunit [Granulibacter bethesdensis]
MSETPFVMTEQSRAIALVNTRRNGHSALRDVFLIGYGIPLPETGKRSAVPGMEVLWNGNGQYLVIGHDPGLASDIRAAAGSNASVTEQGDGRVILHLCGTAVRDVLAKLIPIDLHPRSFGPEDTAITTMAHVTVQIWHPDRENGFHLAIPRSYAEYAIAMITEAAREWQAG